MQPFGIASNGWAIRWQSRWLELEPQLELPQWRPGGFLLFGRTQVSPDPGCKPTVFLLRMFSSIFNMIYFILC